MWKPLSTQRNQPAACHAVMTISIIFMNFHIKYGNKLKKRLFATPRNSHRLLPIAWYRIKGGPFVFYSKLLHNFYKIEHKVIVRLRGGSSPRGYNKSANKFDRFIRLLAANGWFLARMSLWSLSAAGFFSNNETHVPIAHM